MNKYLHDDIDKFFSGHLKDYAEEPAENTWPEIDRRLSEKEKHTSGFRRFAVLSAAAVIAAFLLTPFLLVDPSFNHHTLAGKKSIKKLNKYDVATSDYAVNFIPANKKNVTNKKAGETLINQTNIFLNRLVNEDFSIAEKLPLFNSGELNTEIKQQELYKQKHLNFFEDDLITQNKPGADKAKSTTARPSKKHNISINPFFSFDHISGRFIEQYEYDNDSEDDYKKREKSDISVTSGLLAAYKLNKKFSIISGFSFSSSNLSIASTAVNALKDQDGIYKFKLATTYGLAEFTKSGLIPAAGDSLIISSASLKLKYISFPLMMNYTFRQRKIQLSAHGGIAINKITSDRVEAEYNVQGNNELETVNKIEGIKKIFFTLNSGVEATYPVNRSINVSVSPEIRYGINSINKGTPIKTYPVTYSLGFHVNFKL